MYEYLKVKAQNSQRRIKNLTDGDAHVQLQRANGLKRER